ncbi:MAG: pseudaminic acid cytidylyltransferase [Bacteroidetes bacterium]|nr:pseudaminic acid cytidylyltransferase [Bacteroidota bacterium]
MKYRSLAIIPARGNSKRIPGKNIRNFMGSPIISYSIRAAIESNCFDEVMVSTDDDKIADVAKKHGAKVPFMRSEKNSDDHSTTADVLIEVLEYYKKENNDFIYACCIYPTAPFVTPERLNEARQLLINNKSDSVVPVTLFSYPIFRSLKIENDKLQMIWPGYSNKRSQDLPKAYHDCGQFYFLDVKKFMKNKKIFSDNTIPIIIPESEVQDIDNEEDWKMAETKYSLLRKMNT